MKTNVWEEVRSELTRRGYSEEGEAPNGTMHLTAEYLSSVGTFELVDQLISRREKIFRSGDVVGMEIAKLGYDDVVRAIDALRAVVSRAAGEL